QQPGQVQDLARGLHGTALALGTDLCDRDRQSLGHLNEAAPDSPATDRHGDLHADPDPWPRPQPRDHRHRVTPIWPALRERGGTLTDMSQTIELPRTQGPGSGLGGEWRVIVRNDDHNTFEYVAVTLARTIPGVTVDVGHTFANRIHNTGLAIVWSGHQ